MKIEIKHRFTDAVLFSCEANSIKEAVEAAVKSGADLVGADLRLSKHTCENCDEKGGHWVSTRGSSIQALITGKDDQEGSWTCKTVENPRAM